MATFYKSGETIPILQGVFKGGISWQLKDPDELLALHALCVTEKQPLEALRDPNLDIASWGKKYEQLDEQRKNWREFQSPNSESDRLAFALSLANELWRGVENIEYLQAVLAISEDGDELEARLEKPALMLRSGSVQPLLLTAMPLARKLGKWGLGLYVWWEYGIAPSEWAQNLADALRKRREEKGSFEPLSRLDRLGFDALKDKYAVIVLLHGLLSTDLGSFDPLISKVRSNGYLKDKVALVGWPHDTLAGININAQELQRHINRVLGTGRCRLAFVAHSRGGLLARATAARLYSEEASIWRERLKCCVTFGTPHEGAVLAESPEKLLGLVTVLLSTSSAGKGSLPYVLAYTAARESEGIKNQSPTRGQDEHDSFLYGLLDREKEQVKGIRERLLEILAIGGKVEPDTVWWRWLADRALASTEHDLVVSIASSLPINFRDDFKLETNCNHFQYFDDGQMAIHDRVWTFLSECLKLNDLEVPKEPESSKIVGPVTARSFNLPPHGKGRHRE